MSEHRWERIVFVIKKDDGTTITKMGWVSIKQPRRNG